MTSNISVLKHRTEKVLPAMSAPATPAAPAAGSRNETVIVFALSLAAMVVSMMQTLPVPILGLIRDDLGASTAGVSWVTTATLLSAAVFTPLLGRFGDQHGKKPTLVAVLGVMVAGSVVAALATSLPLLILGRVLQGAATAIFPLALSVLREEIRPQKLPGAMALVSGTLAFGSGLALVATGLLTSGDGADYRNAFWMATGFAALALIAVVTLVPATRHKTGGRTDVLGALTLGLTLLLLLLGISQGHEWGWTSGRTLGSFAGAAVMAVVWVVTELKVAEPLVDMKMFVHRPVLMANLAGPLVDPGRPHLAVEVFEQVAAAQGDGPVQLDGVVHHVLGRLRGQQLRHGRPARHVRGAAVVGARRRVDQEAGGLGAGGHLRHPVGHRLEVAEHPAEGGPGGGVGEGGVQGGPGHAHREGADARPEQVQGVHRDAEALAGPA
jgi:MFS family permease